MSFKAIELGRFSRPNKGMLISGEGILSCARCSVKGERELANQPLSSLSGVREQSSRISTPYRCCSELTSDRATAIHVCIQLLFSRGHENGEAKASMGGALVTARGGLELNVDGVKDDDVRAFTTN